MELIAKRDPSIFSLPSEPNSIRQASNGGSVAARALRENHTFDGEDMTSHPLLANLSNARALWDQFAKPFPVLTYKVWVKSPLSENR